jgi:antibiotic biosynthesis monooxygenase (ABM) superfamily enzyme
MAKVIVQHHVADYDRWHAVFAEHEAVRRGHGATGHSITREVADPNTIVIVNDFATIEGARAFSQDPSLPAAMERGGVDGHPQVWIVDEADTKRYGATLVLLHDVDNIDHWLSSPRRMELFGPLGMSARTFVVDREKSNRVGLVLQVPNMSVFQDAMGSPAAAEAMKFDGVRPETLVILTEA